MRVSKICLDFLFRRRIWFGYSVVSDAVQSPHVHFIIRETNGDVRRWHEWHPSDDIEEFFKQNKIVWYIGMLASLPMEDHANFFIRFSNKTDATKFILMYGGHYHQWENKS